MSEDIRKLLNRVQYFEKEAHKVLSVHEASPSRIINLEDTYKKLKGLSLDQDELFRQALRCIESKLFRAAHVMAWAGFMDSLEEKIGSDGFKKLRSKRPKWKFKNLEELRERVPEHQLIEVCKDLGLCTKNETKSILGSLAKRNECAHPSSFFPKLNDTLGYISELFQRIEILKNKKL